MKHRFLTFVVLVSMSSTVYGQAADPTGPLDTGFLVRYAANLLIGDSVVNITNTWASSTAACLGVGCPAPGMGVTFAQNGDICANIYSYSPDEQLVSCCSCNVTPNALNSLSIKNDLASNTLTPIIPSALVVKVLATPGGATCTAATAATIKQSDLVKGLVAWGTTIHALPVTAGTPATTYGVTETEFNVATLSGTFVAGVLTVPSPEFVRMTQLCGFIRANGSGYGICKSCKVGGLGGTVR